MALFKCKMCGGMLEINNNESVAECEYCGTQQTLPKFNDDKKENWYDRANHFRRNNEFDKAMGIYEQILNEDKTDAEAYWSIILCRYGIEYVEDPITKKRIPTVNRAQFTSIFDDDNYKSALEYADLSQKAIYEEEANMINEIQRGILAISQKEEPFDVFICYKETDNGGNRTQDSVLANDLYHQLTQEGFKVFFARITLEDKLGSAYEPYIFAALNSAKAMVVLGTKPEYFNAVWVKNEWSRYLALIKQGQSKILIPAYKDMDPYDLPEEFSHLQAQDMSKLGFMQDLIRGIKKILGVENKVIESKPDVSTSEGASRNALLDRGFMALEDGQWEKAKEFFNNSLNMDAKLGMAYWGIHLADNEVASGKAYVLRRKMVRYSAKDVVYKACSQKVEEIEKYAQKYIVEDFLSEERIRQIFDYDLMFTSDMADKLEQYEQECKYLDGETNLKRALQFSDEKDKQNIEAVIAKVKEDLKSRSDDAKKDYDKKKKEISNAYEMFFADAIKTVEQEHADAVQKREEKIQQIYEKNVEILNTAQTEESIKNALEQFEAISQYRDVSEVIVQGKACLDEIKRKNDVYRQAIKVMEKMDLFDSFNTKNLEEAIEIFESISGWRDADKKVAYCREEIEKRKLEKADLEKAYAEEKLKYKKRMRMVIISLIAVVLIVIGAILYVNFVHVPKQYEKAASLAQQEKYIESVEIYEDLAEKEYRDAKDKLQEVKYLYVCKNKNSEDKKTYEFLVDLEAYKDSEDIYDELYEWEFKMIVNTDEDDEETDMDEVDWGYIYAYLTATGGYPDEEIDLKVSFWSDDGLDKTEQISDMKTNERIRWEINPSYGTDVIKISIEYDGETVISRKINVK